MAFKPSILLVEDDLVIRNFVKTVLHSAGYRVLEAGDAHTGLMMAISQAPDLILLDLGLPDMDGSQFIKQALQQQAFTIIVISSRDSETDKVQSLDAGAVDYITKPFSINELHARIRVALRVKRSVGENETPQIYRIGSELKIDIDRHIVTRDSDNLHLTASEFKLLELLTKHMGKVLTHRFISENLWGYYNDSATQSLRVLMANLRRKIERDASNPEYIQTEIGVGYRLSNANDSNDEQSQS